VSAVTRAVYRCSSCSNRRRLRARKQRQIIRRKSRTSRLRALDPFPFSSGPILYCCVRQPHSFFTAYDQIYSSGWASSRRTQPRFADNLAPAPHHRHNRPSQIGRPAWTRPRPIVDGRRPAVGVNAIIPPLGPQGTDADVRGKFARDPYTIDDLISFGSISPRPPSFSPLRPRATERADLSRYRPR